MAYPYDPRDMDQRQARNAFPSEHRELERYGEARDGQQLADPTNGIFIFEQIPMIGVDMARITEVRGPLADALRAEGAAARQEEIRLALLAAAEEVALVTSPVQAFKRFAATLEKP